MLKKLNKIHERYTPSEKRIRTIPWVKKFESKFNRKLHFKATRRNIPGAFAIGLFCAFFPIPGQMMIAALIAIYFRKNIPVSVALVWITNPLTIPPIAFFNYRVGAFLLRLDSVPIKFEPTVQWLTELMCSIWWPLLFGTVIIATIFSTVAYFSMTWLWQIAIVLSNRKRLDRNKNKKTLLSSDDTPPSS